MSSLRSLAMAGVLLATSSVFALAQTTTTITTTTIERSEPLRIAPEQRTVIYRTVTRERRVAPPVEVGWEVGRRVPSSVALSPLPESVYVETPSLQRYRYFSADNRVMLVDPETSQVVDILDR
jgi:hypothetical protein